MLGIHVHTTGQFDWPEQQKESVLTVPGSYWLCHKNNIYKFTFKCHRLTRNIKQFEYGRELMKIIRRIIKNPPSQGQKLCTKNLYVTYNHTSWTRRDKMFALFKFRNHLHAVAFPQAFILTIKVVRELSQCLENLSNDITSRSTSCIRDESSRCLEEKANSSVLNDDEPTSNFHINTGCINNHHKYTNKVNFSCLSSSNTNSSTNIKYSNVKDECLHNSSNLLDEQDDKLVTKDSLTEVNREKDQNKDAFSEETQENEQTRENLKTVQQLRRIDNTENITSESVSESLSLDQPDFKEISIEQKRNETLHMKQNLMNTDEEDNTDSASLPYQYLIEKEIESSEKEFVSISSVNAKYGLDNNISEIKTEPSRKYQNDTNLSTELEVNKNVHGKMIKVNCHKMKSTGNIKKNGFTNNRTLRSSNITDLIMKGCMFTIQQDQDSVSVVKQKTKLEVDEVLENSEKAETKEGEKCLLNSSLLKLENLIMMIDEPQEIVKDIDEIEATTNSQNNVDTNKQQAIQVAKEILNTENAKKENVLNSSVILQHDSAARKENSTCPSLFTLNLHNFSKLCSSLNNRYKQKDNIEKYSFSRNITSAKEYKSFTTKMNQVEKDAEEKIAEAEQVENDIVLERPKTNADISLNLKTLDRLKHTNDILLENDISTKCHKDSQIFKTSHNTRSVPRVISNKNITMDQLPSAIKHILQNKYTNKEQSLFQKDESNYHSSECEINSMELRSLLCVTNSETKENIEQKYETFNSDQLKSFECETMVLNNTVENHNIIASTSKEIEVIEKIPKFYKKRKRQDESETEGATVNVDTINNEISSIALMETLSESEKSHKKKRDSTDNHIYKIRSNVAEITLTEPATIERDYFNIDNRLQDITNEFYQCLYQYQKQNKTVEQTCLKEKKKTLDNIQEYTECNVEILKLVQDLTKGVKVVVERLNTVS